MAMNSDKAVKRRLCKEIIEAAKEVTALGGGHYYFITFGEGGKNDGLGRVFGNTVGNGRRLDHKGSVDDE